MRPFLMLTMAAAMLSAQLAEPRSSGVSIGHTHLIVNDPDAQKKVWQDALGGAPTSAGALGLLRFPGIFIIVAKAKADPTGGSAGSSVDHLSFRVASCAAVKSKLAGTSVRIIADEPKRLLAEFPEKILVEFVEDPSVSNLAFQSFHIVTADPAALQAWYVKQFGAEKGKRGQMLTAKLPGGEIEFEKAPAAALPTKGRSLDHIGFEVKGLKAFCDRLAAEGMTFDGPYRVLAQDDNLQIAYIIDPAGTRIELTEGFAGR